MARTVGDSRSGSSGDARSQQKSFQKTLSEIEGKPSAEDPETQARTRFTSKASANSASLPGGLLQRRRGIHQDKVEPRAPSPAPQQHVREDQAKRTARPDLGAHQSSEVRDKPQATQQQKEPKRELTVQVSDGGAERAPSPPSSARTSAATAKMTSAEDDPASNKRIVTFTDERCAVPAAWVESLHPAFRPQLPPLATEGGPVGPWRVVCICERQRLVPGMPPPWADYLVVIPQQCVRPGESDDDVMANRGEQCFEVIFQAAWPSLLPDIRPHGLLFGKIAVIDALDEANELWDYADAQSLRRTLDAIVSTDDARKLLKLDRPSPNTPPVATSTREASAPSTLSVSKMYADTVMPRQAPQSSAAPKPATQRQAGTAVQLCDKYGCRKPNCTDSHTSVEAGKAAVAHVLNVEDDESDREEDNPPVQNTLQSGNTSRQDDAPSREQAQAKTQVMAEGDDLSRPATKRRRLKPMKPALDCD